MTCLIDTNVILDVIGDESIWADWSEQQIAAAAGRGPTIVNDIIYAELCGRYDAVAGVDEVLARLGLTFVGLSRPALFAAGQAHRRYRRRGGPRESLLPDFLIGAHALVEG